MLGVYDSSAAADCTEVRACSLTLLAPRSTRLAVARDTPARAATSSSVGTAPGPLRDLAPVTGVVGRLTSRSVPRTPDGGVPPQLPRPAEGYPPARGHVRATG